jgi:hypothetical protein
MPQCYQNCLLRIQLQIVKAKRIRHCEILQDLEDLMFAEPLSRETTREKMTHIVRQRDKETRKIRRIREVLRQGCDLCYENGIYFN